MKAFVFQTTIVAIMISIASTALAQTALMPALSGVSFLVGKWKSGPDKVKLFGGLSMGSSVITVESHGGVLLRQDHVAIVGVEGQPMGSFDPIMIIYAEDGKVRADTVDGDRVIHYTSSTIVPGHSVTFTSANRVGAPTFKLTYDLEAPDTLAVSTAMARPGETTFNIVETGILKKND